MMTGHRPIIAPKIRQRLRERVSTSPVTIVVGPTGCGKSTQVPPFLLDTLGGPILCTQPRRLAVVAVASRVAEERDTALGGLEVGYHVGQANHSMAATNLVFTTAGILLEELRAQGVKALTKYKVVILDECHERSPEQELCLAMIKLYLSQTKSSYKNQIRLVLMSATFDHARYKSYFSALNLDTPIDTITLETANMVDVMCERVETYYLEDVTKQLKDGTARHSRFLQSMRMDPDAELRGEDGGKSLSLELLNFLRSLILHLDEEEPVEGAFVIFAPTYRYLEQIHDMLTAARDVGGGNTHPWRLGVLHSSMDLEDCLQNMQPDEDDNETEHRPFRKILLASAIADSSVTIPGVSCVVDLCRALQVEWNSAKTTHVARTTWASQSICNQRQGRTGRTCPGRCFRLVSKGFFIGRLEQWEEPLLAISSCRNEVIKLLCSTSSSNASTDPVQVLNQCLDPPPSDVVQDAFAYLQSIGACVAQGKKGTYVPTKMGDLLAALPLTVEDSQIVVAGAQMGLLHETLALRAVMSHKPAPIVHHFGDNAVNDANILCYYDQAEVGTPESLQMANLSAFLYWDVAWNQCRCRAAMEQFAHATGASPGFPPELADFCNPEVDASKPCCNVWRWCPALEEKHTQWCRARGINPTSVRGVAELIQTALNVFYVANLEPEWLRSTDPTPLWRRFRDWKGKQTKDYVNSRDVLAMVYDFTGENRLSKALMALSDDPTKAMNDMSKDHILDIASLPSTQQVRSVKKQASLPIACVHFLEGKCTFGAKCRNSHSPFAIRPACKFFARNGGCIRGDKCVFAHDDELERATNPELANMTKDPLSSLAPTIESLSLPEDILDWFEDCHETLFLLGDGNFDFTRSLITLGVGPPYSSDYQKAQDDLKQIATTNILQLDATRMHLVDLVTNLVTSSRIDTFLWNFPFTGDEEHDEPNEGLILGTFHSLLHVFRRAVQVRHDELAISLAFTLQGDQFSRWNVLGSAARTGWRLSSWGKFDPSDFAGYRPRRASGDVFPASSPRFYEFRFHSYQLTGQ